MGYDLQLARLIAAKDEIDESMLFSILANHLDKKVGNMFEGDMLVKWKGFTEQLYSKLWEED